MQMFLLREGILDEKGINKLEKQVDEEIQIATDQALRQHQQRRTQSRIIVYSPNVDPTTENIPSTDPPISITTPKPKKLTAKPWRS